MKILIPTMGTRGDIQPYVALGQSLTKSGHEVTFATHPYWGELITNYGLKFHPIGPDVNIEIEAARIRGGSRHWMQGMIRTMKFMFRIIEGASSDIRGLCGHSDLVVASHSHIGASEAQASGVPYVSVTLQPSIIPRKPETRPPLRRIVDQAVGYVFNPLMVGPYNRLRRKLGVSPVPSFYHLVSPHLNLIPVSPIMYPPDERWEAKNVVVGYWFTTEEESYCPPAELVSFLSTGPKPLVVSLGAMSFERQAELSKVDGIISAISRAGHRAIIQGFDITLANYPLPENFFRVGSVDHGWLFPRSCGVIHHGGFGTTASVLRAGVPAIVIPHALDQFEWANRIHSLGLGPNPLPANSLNEESLFRALEFLSNNIKQLSTQAEQIQKVICAEDGLAEAVTKIEDLTNRWR